jgi:hypothetical protein
MKDHHSKDLLQSVNSSGPAAIVTSVRDTFQWSLDKILVQPANSE